MISVIVPVYNAVKYLPQCIESLINQTFSDIEVILVDDGSTDGSFDVCERYSRQDARITVLHKSNGGPVSARKAGLQAAHGQYISFADGDDWMEPDMLERMYQRLIGEHVDVVMCGRYEDTEDQRRKVFHGIPEGRYGKRELLQFVYPKMIAGTDFFEWGIFPGVWDKLFRRTCIEPFQNEVDDRITMGDDAACTYPCLLNADSIYVMQECFYHYRQTASSVVKAIPDKALERERFRILYQSVDESFQKYVHIFDLRAQWKRYLLFLMVPRADTLLEGIEDLEYLFPFPKVKKNDRIILYGMGTYGQRLYRYVMRTGFCDIVSAVDRNYRELRKQGVPAEPPENITKYEYDAIVVASSFAGARAGIYQELCLNCSSDKIHLMDEALICSDEIQKRFGLIEEL